MEPGTQTTSPSYLSFTLELLSEDPHEKDPALLSAIEQDLTNVLRTEGYTLQHKAAPGAKGLDQVILQVGILLSQIPPDILAKKDAIDILSALCTIFASIIPAGKRLLEAYTRRTAGSHAPVSPIKISIEIDGDPITVEAADLTQAEAALHLAQRFHAQYSARAAQVTPHSTVKMKGSLPGHQPGRRR